MRTGIKCAVCMALVASVLLVFVSQVQAKPESVVGPTAAAMRKTQKASVIEVRKRADDKTYDFILLKDDKIIAFTQQQGKPAKETTPVRTYNVEKIKAAIAKQTNAAEYANGLVLKLPEIQQRRPVIRAVTVRENDQGKIDFLVSVYDVGLSYKKTYVVDTDKWEVLKDQIEIGDPCRDQWTKEAEGGEAGSDASAAETPKGDAAAETPAKPAAKPAAPKADSAAAEEEDERASRRPGGAGRRATRGLGGGGQQNRPEE